MGFDATTFFFEIINFIVLVWLLQRLVYKPLRGAIDKRRAEIEAEQRDVAKALERVEELKAELKTKSASLDDLRDATIREATDRASRERARILEQAAEDAASERKRAERLLETEREAALGWVKSLAVEKGTELAGKMLAELAPDSIDSLLAEQLSREIEASKDKLRQEAEARASLSDGGVDVEIVWAKWPTNEVLEPLKATLSQALGDKLRLSVKEDASLEGGLRVRVGDRVLDASIAGHLEALRERALALVDDEAKIA